MKILRLSIKNIASIENAEIDFENGPLATDPIFLITGDTGAGKSTILNAISLALYDKVPALETIGTSEEDSSNIKTDSTRQLMRKGSTAAFVELTFVGNDDKRYTAKWETGRARKKATGKIQPVNRQLADLATGVTYTGQKEVTKQILEITGLTFDQFTRTTMLAQGQFASFMKAKDEDKSDILEKLTGTEIYARIGVRVNMAYKEAVAKHACLEAEIRGANPLNDEQKAELNAKIANLGNVISALDRQLAAADRHIAWTKTVADLRAKLREKILAKNDAQNIADSEHNKRQLAAIKMWDETAEIRRTIATKNEAMLRLAQLKERINALAAEKWREIADGIAWMETECRRLSENAQAIQAEMERQERFAPIYDNAQRIDVLCASITATAKEAAEHASACDKHKKLVADSLNKEKDLESQAIKAEKEFAAQETIFKEKEGEAKKHDIQKTASLLQEAVKQKEAVAAAIDAIERHAACAKSVSDAETALQDAQKTCDEQQQSLTSYSAAFEHAKAEHAMRHAFAQGQMELRDHIASLRKQFALTGECPLCGSKGVHIHEDEAIAQKVLEAQAAEAKAKNALDEIAENVAHCNAMLQVHRKSVADCLKRLTDAKEEARAAEKKAMSLAPGYNDIGAIDAYRAKAAEIEKAKANLSRQLTDANDAFKAYDDARKKLDTLRQGRDKAAAMLDKQRQATKDAEIAAKTEQLQADMAMEKAKGILDDICGIIALESDDANAAFSAMLLDATGQCSVTIDTAPQAASFVSAKATEREKGKKRLESLLAQSKEMQQRLTECSSASMASRLRFNGAYIATPRPVPDIEAKVRAIIAEASAIDGETAAVEKKREKADAEIALWFDHSPITRQDVEEISKQQQATIDRYRLSTQAISDTLMKATHQANAIKEQADEAENNRPSDLADDATLEGLEHTKAAISEQRDTATAEKAKCETLLKADQELAASIAERKGMLAQLAELKNKWEILDRCFGTADGSRFKKVAQSYVLRALLAKANFYLNMLSPRYCLDCDDGSLTINVLDGYQDGQMRNVGLLSGGESFIVSLALSLGLSSISKEKINVDTLFIDEGFGSLDQDTLNTVITTFDRLHSRQGRRIGIISHVEALKERIPTQIVLTRTGGNSSKVDVI